MRTCGENMNHNRIEQIIRENSPPKAIIKCVKSKVSVDAKTFLIFPYPNEKYLIDGKEKQTATCVTLSRMEER